MAMCISACGLENILYLEPPIAATGAMNHIQFKHASSNAAQKERLISYSYEVYYKIYLGDDRLEADMAALDAAFANAVSAVPAKLSSMGFKQLVTEEGSAHSAIVDMAEIDSASLYFDYALDSDSNALLFRKASDPESIESAVPVRLYRANRESTSGERCEFSRILRSDNDYSAPTSYLDNPNAPASLKLIVFVSALVESEWTDYYSQPLRTLPAASFTTKFETGSQ
jgi:hypothetical protein